jgi:hypothetical protein
VVTITTASVLAPVTVAIGFAVGSGGTAQPLWRATTTAPGTFAFPASMLAMAEADHLTFSATVAAVAYLYGAGSLLVGDAV